MNKRNILILLLGIGLVFLSLYLFTRPALFTSLDFTNTGPIGDTIGGITAPIINIVGALLVYVSFQAQLEANKIQTKALSEEKLRNKVDGIYQKHLVQFEEIKGTLRNLEFIVEFWADYLPNNTISKEPTIVFKGLNALNEYTNRIVSTRKKESTYSRQNYQTFSMFLNYQFMLRSLYELIISIELKIDDKSDKEHLLNNIKTFYNTFLKVFGDRIIFYFGEENQEVEEIIRLRDFMNKKFGA